MMLALVSPAKKLDMTPRDRGLPHSQPVFLDESEKLVQVARRLGVNDLKQLMSISDNLAELNRERFRAFSTPFTPDNAAPAIFAFRGDTYQGLDADSLSDAEITYAQDHLGILSGLYGLLRPLDLMQAYRLEMGVKLHNPRGEDLYDFWGDRITGEINRRLADAANPVVVNLASNEYFRAVRRDKLQARLITPVFKEVKGGVAKVIGLMAKRARGMMARHIIQNRIDDPADLRKFNAGGYRFMPELSDDDKLEFHRAA